VEHSVQELEVHSRIFDEMGFLPATPYNKINIHVGGTYGGNKEATLRRFAQVRDVPCSVLLRISDYSWASQPDDICANTALGRLQHHNKLGRALSCFI
jgi:UV DNA damage repair endonuclease